ncbi:hypothetical protein [Xenorhabdus stockiae]|uniref:hypothetical protein n=1 Tax=Xenorhabdus stockiae TaxID=351614 RepID=UPI0040637876
MALYHANADYRASKKRSLPDKQRHINSRRRYSRPTDPYRQFKIVSTAKRNLPAAFIWHTDLSDHSGANGKWVCPNNPVMAVKQAGRFSLYAAQYQ